MKTRVKISTCIVLLFLLTGSLSAFGLHQGVAENTLDQCIDNLEYQIKAILDRYDKDKVRINKQLVSLDNAILASKRKRKVIQLMIRRDHLQDSLKTVLIKQDLELTRVRFVNGIQIIKILYDRLLALDHHYTSLNTIQSIQKMSNPSNYPSYVNSRDKIIRNQSKKSGIDLSGILGENIYTNIMHSFIALFSSQNILKEDKHIELKKMECIIDFTLRMNTDLNTIHYEMQFLKHFNEETKVEIERLYEDFINPLEQNITLEESRTQDLWISVEKEVQQYTDQLALALEFDNDPSTIKSKLDNLKFSIDQLYFFIHRYQTQTNQSVNFYRKFKIMLEGYTHIDLCNDQIPDDFKNLRANIDLTITKFQKAYGLGELRGSKLRQLLYGSVGGD